MAITVELKITPLEVSEKRVSITATYTDDTDPGNPKVINISSAVLGTAQQKTEVLDNIHAHYQALLTRESAINTFISDLETVGASNLEARL